MRTSYWSVCDILDGKGPGHYYAAGIRDDAENVNAGRVDAPEREASLRYEPPTVRCGDCARVRIACAGEWDDHPGLLPREIQGICSACLARRGIDARAKWKREGRKLLNDRRRGHGTAAEGTDPFKGFRGE